MKFEAFTAHTMARAAADNFMSVRRRNKDRKGQLVWHFYGDDELHNRVLELGSDPNPDDVARIIGPHWVSRVCDFCSDNVAEGVRIDCGEIGYDVCKTCLGSLETEIAKVNGR